jgi:hypothetical protein
MPKRNRKMTNLIAVRLDEERLAKLRAWRKEQDDPPNNAEAIRQLFDLGLEAWDRGERPKPESEPETKSMKGEKPARGRK